MSTPSWQSGPGNAGGQPWAHPSQPAPAGPPAHHGAPGYPAAPVSGGNPPPAPGNGAPPAVLDLTIHQLGAFGMSMLPVTVELNGIRQVASVGENRYLLPPGHHHLTAWATWIAGRFGEVAYDLDVQPGQQVALTWALPTNAFIRQGTIGPGPQKVKGVGCLIAVAAVTAVLIILMIVVAVLGSSN